MGHILIDKGVLFRCSTCSYSFCQSLCILWVSHACLRPPIMKSLALSKLCVFIFYGLLFAIVYKNVCESMKIMSFVMIFNKVVRRTLESHGVP